MITSLSELCTKFQINDFANVDPNTIKDIVSNAENIDKEVFIGAMNLIPQMKGVINTTITSFVTMVESDNKMSAESKKFYNNMSETILMTIQSETVPDDIKRQLMDLLPQIMKQMAILDSNDAESIKANKNIMKNVFGGIFGVLAVVLAGSNIVKNKK